MKTTEITGLSAQRTVEVVNALQQLLADLQVHYTNLRHLHWFVKGRGFFVMHEKYEEFYNDTAESRFSAYLKTAQVSELEGVANGREAVGYVLDTLRTLIADERQALRQASEIGDEVTVSLMSDYLKEQEKTAWMLTAFNTPKDER
jgi:starvation-inducible DNA-binding protein